MNIESPLKKYVKEEHFVHSCQYHVIFCPKYRRRVLENGIDLSLKKAIKEKEKEYKYKVIELEVMPDHVHLLLQISPQVSVKEVVGQIKGYTSNKLHKMYPALHKRLPTMWTRSCFISSCGAVTLEAVKKYIEDQKGV